MKTIRRDKASKSASGMIAWLKNPREPNTNDKNGSAYKISKEKYIAFSY